MLEIAGTKGVENASWRSFKRVRTGVRQVRMLFSLSSLTVVRGMVARGEAPQLTFEVL